MLLARAGRIHVRVLWKHKVVSCRATIENGERRVNRDLEVAPLFTFRIFVVQAGYPHHDLVNVSQEDESSAEDWLP
jgi:hypothetical protein